MISLFSLLCDNIFVVALFMIFHFTKKGVNSWCDIIQKWRITHCSPQKKFKHANTNPSVCKISNSTRIHWNWYVIIVDDVSAYGMNEDSQRFLVPFGSINSLLTEIIWKLIETKKLIHSISSIILKRKSYIFEYFFRWTYEVVVGTVLSCSLWRKKTDWYANQTKLWIA